MSTDLAIVKDGKAKHTELERARQLGTIVIRCRHRNIVGPQGFLAGKDVVQGAGIVSEKCLKGGAISHTVE